MSICNAQILKMKDKLDTVFTYHQKQTHRLHLLYVWSITHFSPLGILYLIFFFRTSL